MPNVRRQTTLSAPASCRSLSLHGGRPTTLTARPAPIGTGLLFRRLDVTDRDNIVPVSPAHVVDVRNCTTLANAADVRVSTVEHLLAAVAAAGIDNLLIDISGPELPAEDGSAEPFMKMIEEAGIVRQAAPRRYVRVLRPVEVEHANGSHARIEPCDRLELDVTIDFDDAAIGRQRVALAPDVHAFRNRLASARTFARKHEVAALQEAGLSMGGSFDNAVLVDGDEVLNPGGLRQEDEFVCHKALDLMGDLYVGGPVLGRVTAFKPGHGLNHDLLNTLFATPGAWAFETLPGAKALASIMRPRLSRPYEGTAIPA